MSLKKIASFAGRVIVLLSFIFLFYLLSTLDLSSIEKYFKLSWIPMIAGLAILFSFFYFFVAYAYKLLLQNFSKIRLDTIVIYTYLQTVVMKYIPGNVFHFLGRHTLAKDFNLDHKSIVVANSLEIIMQLIGVGVIFLVGVVFFGFSLNFGGYLDFGRDKLSVVIGVLIIGLISVLFLKKYNRYIFDIKNIYSTIKVLVLHMMFILGSSTIFSLVLWLFFDYNYSFDSFAHTIFIASIAWFLGFVVPGAPGGVGIRESVLTLLLPLILSLPKEIVLVGALIYRVITILGEALTFFWAKFIKKRIGVEK